MRQRLLALLAPPKRANLEKADRLIAATVFAPVFAATFPVVLPFLFMQSAGPTLRESIIIAVSMLFLIGFIFERFANRSPRGTGLSTILLGNALLGGHKIVRRLLRPPSRHAQRSTAHHARTVSEHAPKFSELNPILAPSTLRNHLAYRTRVPTRTHLVPSPATTKCNAAVRH